ncbi:GPP34 family phosphoprotein [Mycobacterium sp. EPa45]|uniref:GOLPH3/VPS74 family protein n=1 Tax=Mycobacterium sp. EPa45 TaxID=1545728 RepID=UPI00069B6278|nr:GPP34 family phosphoprotein [Mycobacterium sp. EPa45]
MENIGGPPAEFSQVPPTLHGQLFLLAFDPKSRRFDGYDPTLFSFALRAAMLTELHLRGFLTERAGWAVPARAASPDNPILRAAFAQIGVHNRATWTQLIAGDEHEAISAVREQLVNEGWLRTRQQPGSAVCDARLEPYDESRVAALADEVGGALRNAIAGLAAEPWSVGCALLAALAELPTMADVQDRDRLDELASGALVPVSGLAEAIRNHRGGSRTWIAGGS